MRVAGPRTANASCDMIEAPTDISGIRRHLFRGFGLLAVGLTACIVHGARAQDAAAQFPSRDITLIVPCGAGGPPDSVARVVAAGLSKSLGKPVIVENRVGASTAIAARAVARAEPDGYTLMAVDISYAVTPHIVA